ncbi:MAG TPA: NUDIX domain-containing protein [Candidatus Limnocylindria bacterium]
MRAAVLLLDGDTIALIERLRGGLRYYLFPGGGVEAGETPEDAAARETNEELGLEIEIVRLIARARFSGVEQRYYLARATGGRWGTGHGEEMTGTHRPERGSYRAVRWPVARLTEIDLRPAALGLLVRQAIASGWPAEVTDVS